MKTLTKSLFLTIVVIGTIVLEAAPVIEQQVRGSLTLIASPKANVNPSSPFDQVVLPNVVIPFNVAEIGGTNQLRSTFQWAGKTKNGFSVDWQLAGPGEGAANWNAGTFSFELPFIFNCAGKRLPLRLKFTSGQHTDAFGSVQGFARKVSDTSADLLLHAPASFFFNWKDLLPTGENKNEEFVGRVTFRGQLVAINDSKLFD
jgi:hypothetical protein